MAAATATRTRATARRRPTSQARRRPTALARRRPSRRTYALRRAFVSAVVLALLVAAFSAGTALRSDAADTPSADATVVVAEGDTVWDIAVAHLPEGGNAHAYVAEVLEHNDLDAAALRPGTLLRLPR